MSSDLERHSRALEVVLITDPEERARQEARNGLRQFDCVIEAIEYWLNPERRPFRLRPSFIYTLNRIALEGINSLAGVPRPGPVEISGSKHEITDSPSGLCDVANELDSPV
jgi:hypothetical protein